MLSEMDGMWIPDKEAMVAEAQRYVNWLPS